VPLPLAIQLYSFRDPARFGGAGIGLDVPTLSAIAEAGYLGVETVDVQGADPVELRRILDDLGLAVTSSHTWAGSKDRESMRRAAARIAELGSPRLIISAGRLRTLEVVDSFVDDIASAAEIARAHGLRLGVHNHSDEMATLDGTRVIERLASGAPDHVDFQVDIFWATVGAAEPAEVIQKLGRRVVSLHLKDGAVLPSAADAEPFVNVTVGTGIVDPAAAIAAAQAAGSVEWLIVEFDHVDGSAIEAARQSLDNLVARGLARGQARR
jgi:sugar phosphate isomerase/epimerase